MAAQRTLALVGGTGLTELEDAAETLVLDTPYGAPSAPVRVVETEPLRLLFLPWQHLQHPHRL